MQAICGNIFPPSIEAHIDPNTIVTIRPDMIKEMYALLTDNSVINTQPDSITTDTQLIVRDAVNFSLIYNKMKDSENKLCFITHKGAKIIKRKWFLVQIDMDNSSDTKQSGIYYMKFFRCHPKDSDKSHNSAQYWPDWN